MNREHFDPPPVIGEANDPLEAAADRMAGDAIAPGHASTSTEAVRRAPFAHPSRAVAAAGRALDEPVRRDMQRRFGHDFSRVRVHSDQAAARSARDVGAKAYTLGEDIVFGAGRYAPASHEGRRLLAHELAHVVQQRSGAVEPGTLQREPVFTDGSCAGGNRQERIEEYVARALELTTQAIAALSDPESVAGPLERYFSIRVDQPGHLAVLVPLVARNLEKLRVTLEGPVPSRCEGGPKMWGTRAQTTPDPETGMVDPEEGVTYNRNLGKRNTVVDTIIHEYGHLAGIGHAGPEGEPISNEGSTRVRGLGTFEAMNNAESYMRFVRAVT